MLGRRLLFVEEAGGREESELERPGGSRVLDSSIYLRVNFRLAISRLISKKFT